MSNFKCPLDDIKECPHIDNLHYAINQAMVRNGEIIITLQEIENELVKMGTPAEELVKKIKTITREK
jgi:hypothetical protein